MFKFHLIIASLIYYVQFLTFISSKIFIEINLPIIKVTSCRETMKTMTLIMNTSSHINTYRLQADLRCKANFRWRNASGTYVLIAEHYSTISECLHIMLLQKRLSSVIIICTLRLQAIDWQPAICHNIHVISIGGTESRRIIESWVSRR